MTRTILGAALAAALLIAPAAQAAKTPSPLAQVKHIVVIYEENHSFDNLYGGWEGVTGVAKPTPRTRRRSTRPARRTSACCRTTSTSRRRR